ncbi:unnamed protein product [Acanthoscelides obtectus]|uniref:Protein unc-80 homolog n=1 Tax=Acanthoscelides obtectus TaxID=200917 RepID=A0A9P0Q4N2_ACAOB|nr:unnamed protein product [Acanthoscelides obtectus]CAK1636247.1 Protein unc-80 homolog [Acanthoscelides obtectus]
MPGKETNNTQCSRDVTDDVLPIPIQIFLWKQVSPFVRPKLGKHHEASCVFCQQASIGHHELKEACKVYEKVVVQNIQSGLKPDIAEIIRSVPRWKLIQASLPYVMHSVSSVLHNRLKDGNLQTLGAVETKLLYTLHWIILDAGEECSDEDFEKGVFHPSPFYYIFPISSIALFIYLFAPICNNLKESDFQNFRLENGLKIWQALWDFKHPDAACFFTQCKPEPRFLSGKRPRSKQFGDVFVGRKPSQEDPLARDSPTMSHAVSASSSDQPSFPMSGAPSTVTITATITKIDDEGGWVSSPKDTAFPETIPEESSSTEEEHVVIFRLPSLHESDGFLRDPSIYTAETSIIQLAMRRNGAGRSNKVDQAAVTASTDNKSTGKPPMQKAGSSTDKDSLDSSKVPSVEAQQKEEAGKPLDHEHKVNAATFLDVAVLRCLFMTHWQEDGIYWALAFLYNRLREINEEASNQQQPRRRSNSLPIPKIEVSLYQSNDFKKSSDHNQKDFIEVPEPKDVSLLAECPYSSQAKSDESLHKRAGSEKSKRRMKIADLKTFVETKLLSKSEKALEKIGQEEPKSLGQVSVGSRRFLNQECHRSLDTGDDTLSSRPQSSFSKIFEPPSNLVKGKSMPSLSCLIDELNAGGYTDETHWECTRSSRLTNSQPMTNPIITVTEHTPTPSPDYLKKETYAQSSMDSQLDAASLSGSKLSGWQDRKSSLTRSQTDSNITYAGEEVQEAHGSTRYITRDGEMDLQVVLKAVHRTAVRENTSCTLRVLEVILNLAELLLDMGVLKQCLRDEVMANISSSKKEAKFSGVTKVSPGSTADTPYSSDAEKTEKKVSPHRMMMNIIVRVLKHLGCPHGCMDGQRGPAAEFLRTQCQNIFSKLNRASGNMLKKYLRDFVRYQPMNDILDFFHAYLGYCVDPSSLLSPLSAGVGRSRGIEGQVVGCAFKQMVTRFIEASKEIKTSENLATYCEIRQMMTYVKEAHGSVFRKVALSALIDTADRPSKKEPATQTTRVIRHMHPSEIEDIPDAPTDSQSFSVDDKGIRKQLFKKRSTSSTCASLLETEAEELLRTSQSPLGNLRKKHHVLTPRHSERALGIAMDPSVCMKSKRSKFGGIVNWFKKGDSSSTDDQEMRDNGESVTDTASFVRKPSVYYQKPSKSNVIKKAKRRMEGKFKFVLKKGKRKMVVRRTPELAGETSRESEFVVLKERKLVSTTLVHEGVARLSFLLETCPPGSVPDAHLLASTLTRQW